MATNAGTKITTQEATVPGYGSVWYDEDAIANISSLANMVKKNGFRVVYDSDIENAFILVYSPDPEDPSKQVTRKFTRSPEGL
jgi:hypothetical protein